MKEVGRRRRRRTQLLDDLTNRRRYWELKEEAEDKKDGNDRVSVEHKSMDLLISSILNNNEGSAAKHRLTSK